MRVFNIPSSAPFLRTLISALVDGELVPGFNARTEPDRLMHATLYLPTRRACLLAHDIFLDVLGLDAVVLPRLVQLGNIDESEIEFANAEIPPVSEIGEAASSNIPPKLGELTRRMALAELVAAWAKQLDPNDPLASPLVVGGPASTLALATDLAKLMDDMVTRGVSYDALNGLVPDALDKYWQLTLDFLRIAREYWPLYLDSVERIEPAARRDLLIEAEAKRLIEQHQHGPVIAAGSTGSMPTTAKFLNAIARLPQGAVVLPGLDMDLDDAAWALIGGSEDAAGKQLTPPSSNHPQYALHALLTKHLGIERRDVMQLAAPAAHGRELLASEMMRPSSATAHWHARLNEPAVELRIAAGMQNLAVIAAPNTEMEALAIAIAMREAREQNKTANLITPDRALARRVTAALTRWNLEFDDSGGDSLTDSPAGIFARLSAEAATEELEPPTLLALLKHPLFRLGRAPGGWTHAIETLELALLRGTRPAPGTAGLARDFANFRTELAKARAGKHAMIHRSEPRAQLADADLDDAAALIAALRTAFAPLEQLNENVAVDFSDLVARHRLIVEALSLDTSDGSGEVQAFASITDGKALRAAFDDLAEQAPVSKLMVKPGDYAEVFVTAFGDRIVRPTEKAHARLRIFGTIDARLTQADRVILGGLVEGIWPPSPRVDPWLSRPMRHQLKLDLPERRIGLSAHDFVQMLGADEVVISHAAKVGGAPAVASRFLHRLEAVAGKDRWDAAVAAGENYVAWAGELDKPVGAPTPISKPEPKPPREARPLRMSVTGIEDWLRDPYTIYASQILKLSALDPVDMPLSAADRGSAIHNSIGDFTEAYCDAELPDNAAAILREFGVKHFAPLMERPEARALWWPRFLRIAGWFAGWELERRTGVLGIHAETRGAITIPLTTGRTFHLSARADRIERRTDHTYAILDYKTGNPPTAKQVRMGLSPQLSLEAAILRSGGFDGIRAGSSVSELLYIRLSGNNPPGEERVLKLKDDDGSEIFPDDIADDALAKLKKLIEQFEDDTTPYTSLNLAMWSNRYGSYDDLARIKEWSAVSGDGDES